MSAGVWPSIVVGVAVATATVTAAQGAYYEVRTESLTVDLESETARADANLREWEATAQERDAAQAELAHLRYWEGFLVGEVVVCEGGAKVAMDEWPGGLQWAACM